MNRKVHVYEVGPRDGLQNEKITIASADKIRFIELLDEVGFERIEATSFVRPGAIPQMSDASVVYPAVRGKGAKKAALVPNARGMLAALDCGLEEGAIFTAASDSFTQHNINCTIAESLERFSEVAAMAREKSVPLRGYVSCVVECPYEGRITPQKVLEVCERLIDLGVYEISLGETIGVAVPDDIARLLDVILNRIDSSKIAGHYHDTRGTALSNVFRSLEMGVRTFDSSAGGLGGCPYAPGASGNLATEDLVYALHRSGYDTGLDMARLWAASAYMQSVTGKRPASRAFSAFKR
jgi:hydroxymethylglutaryl-CoA lyase